MLMGDEVSRLQPYSKPLTYVFPSVDANLDRYPTLRIRALLRQYSSETALFLTARPYLCLDTEHQVPRFYCVSQILA